LEFISRALAVHKLDSSFIFGLSFKNNKGVGVVFILEWHDGTMNDGYIYDEEIAKLSDILQGIVEEKLLGL